MSMHLDGFGLFVEDIPRMVRFYKVSIQAFLPLEYMAEYGMIFMR